MSRASQPPPRSRFSAVVLLALLAGACELDRKPIVPIYHGQLRTAAGSGGAGGAMR